MIVNVRQTHYLPVPDRPVRESFTRLAGTLRRLRQHRQAFLFLAAYFFYIDGVDTIIKMAAVYGTDCGVGQEALLLMVLAVQIVGFPAALLFGKLATRFKAKPMLLFGVGVYIVVTIFAANARTPLHFWILAVAIGCVQGGVQGLSRSVFGKTIPKQRSAEFFGFYNIFGRFATILGPLLVGGFAHLTGDVGHGILSIVVLFIIGGAILALVDPEAQAEPGQETP